MLEAICQKSIQPVGGSIQLLSLQTHQASGEFFGGCEEAMREVLAATES